MEILSRRFPKIDAAQVYDFILDVVRQSLLEGHAVNLRNLFTLCSYVDAGSRGYDPRRGRVVPRPPRHRLRMTLATDFDDALAGKKKGK